MIKSMTAFGRAKQVGEKKDITIELKSVNSRFFDCNVKLPRAYIFLEERIKEHVRKNAVSRAKVDVFVTVDNHTSGLSNVGLDAAYLESYLSALGRLRDEYGLKDDISVMSVARNQEIFTYDKPEEDLEAEWEVFRAVLDEAIAGYNVMRTLEGEKAERDIKAKIELVRLRSHFGAFYDIAASGEPSGRKLDFLMQELNRETNTIGSKANNARIARIVVNMKGELEKIREQVQNIE